MRTRRWRGRTIRRRWRAGKRRDDTEVMRRSDRARPDRTRRAPRNRANFRAEPTRARKMAIDDRLLMQPKAPEHVSRLSSNHTCPTGLSGDTCEPTSHEPRASRTEADKIFSRNDFESHLPLHHLLSQRWFRKARRINFGGIEDLDVGIKGVSPAALGPRVLGRASNSLEHSRCAPQRRGCARSRG